jgi:putative spermidine/putrescine transport system substrate-binding protein
LHCLRIIAAAAVLAAGASRLGHAQPPSPAPGPAPGAAQASPQAPGRQFTIVARPGDWEAALPEVMIHPFTLATAIPVTTQTWPGGADALKAGLKAWDVVQVSGDEMLAACDDGLLEKLDWSAIGGRDHYQPTGTADCGVAAFVAAQVLAWDRDKFPGTPTWSDFFDVAKIPGKRGLPRSPRGTLEVALLADGVAPGEIYRTLRSSDGVDRAFRKLDQLRPYIAWWQVPEDATKMLGSGEVLMTAAPNGRVTVANRTEHHNFGVQWSGALLSLDWWVVPKGSAFLRAAQQFLYFVGTPAIEARMVAVVPYPGMAKGVADFIPPELQAVSPISPQNAQAMVAVDESFWRDNQDKLSARFTSWLSH